MIDPESQTADVLALEGGHYVMLVRAGVGQKAASRLLPGFEVSVEELIGGERPADF